MNASGMSKRGQHQRKRVYKGIMGRRPDLKASRKKSTDERKAAYNKLTTQEKIKLLDDGCFAAKKQRAKLLAQLQLELASNAQKANQKKNSSK